LRAIRIAVGGPPSGRWGGAQHWGWFIAARAPLPQMVCIAGKPAPTDNGTPGRPSLVPKLRFGNGSSGLGTASWESKLELLHSCVPKLELGNKMDGGAWEQGGDLDPRL